MVSAGFYDSFLRFLQEHMLSCPSRKYLHMDCPGCGMQRSILGLLKGNLSESLHFHPAGIFILLSIVLLLIHLKFKFTWGAKALISLQITVAIISITFYVYKIIHHQIFY